MKILINNEEVVCDKEIVIEEKILATSSTILKNCYPKSWELTKDYTSNYYYPVDYSKCKIYDDEENLIFCGVIKNTGIVNLNPRQPHFTDLQVLDFKTLLSEGETLDYVIVNKTVSEAIEQVVASINSYGFVVGNIEIEKDDIIGAYSTKDKTAYDVFQYLADITQSKWFTRLIDENTVAIDFYNPNLLEDGTQFDYLEIDESIIDITYNYSTNDYRNKQVMTSQEVYSNVITSNTFTADGYNKQFNTMDKIGIINKIFVNGEEKTVLTENEKNIGLTADFYYKPGENSFESRVVYSLGTIINIEYFAIIEGRQILLNQNEISRIENQINRNGTISRYENRNDATTTNELTQIGLSYLEFKGKAETIINISTRNNNLWDIGQVVNVSNIPVSSLNDVYMVKSKKTTILPLVNEIFYSFELSNSYNSEDKVNYFDNQRAKQNGNIGQGEYISRNVDIQNTANIYFYDLEVEEITITNSNKLQSTLQSEFVD